MVAFEAARVEVEGASAEVPAPAVLAASEVEGASAEVLAPAVLAASVVEGLVRAVPVASVVAVSVRVALMEVPILAALARVVANLVGLAPAPADSAAPDPVASESLAADPVGSRPPRIRQTTEREAAASAAHNNREIPIVIPGSVLTADPGTPDMAAARTQHRMDRPSSTAVRAMVVRPQEG